MQTVTAGNFADLLLVGHSDGTIRSMRPGADGTISVNLTDLTMAEKTLAQNALAEISRMTGLRFSETTGSAKITYLNHGASANTSVSMSGTTINSATVRINSDRVAPGDSYGSFAFRTYMHETLHALGLGHPQDYGSITDFGRSAIANDSWQISVMSYFDQNENSAINATKAYHLTPMLADYLALQRLYGMAAIHTGATTYGVGSTAGGSLDRVASLGAGATYLIVDSSGVDHLNFSSATGAQRIDLTPGAISNTMGAVGNMQIAPGTVLEHVTSGSGADLLQGNAAANRLLGGAGADTVSGREGNDSLDGQAGNDLIHGDAGDDWLSGGAGNDTLNGGAGHDTLTDSGGANSLDGGAGNDRLIGGTGADMMIGGAGSDSLNGNAGNDTLNGGAGGDRMFAGDGADILRGGDGHDILIGGAGNDFLYGDAGNDDLAAEAGSDVLDGGAGNDMLRGGAGADRFIFSSGQDTVRNFDHATDVIDLRGIDGLSTWAQVRALLVQSGNHVVIQSGTDSMRIEWSEVGQFDRTDFLW